MVDATDLKSVECDALAGSSPAAHTIKSVWELTDDELFEELSFTLRKLTALKLERDVVLVRRLMSSVVLNNRERIERLYRDGRTVHYKGYAGIWSELPSNSSHIFNWSLFEYKLGD